LTLQVQTQWEFKMKNYREVAWEKFIDAIAEATRSSLWDLEDALDEFRVAAMTKTDNHCRGVAWANFIDAVADVIAFGDRTALDKDALDELETKFNDAIDAIPVVEELLDQPYISERRRQLSLACQFRREPPRYAPVAAIQKLVEYLYSDEQRNYNSEPEPDHIFCAVREVAEWIRPQATRSPISTTRSSRSAPIVAGGA
jgi:hypothetical protein